jgi:hypothetical protein
MAGYASRVGQMFEVMEKLNRFEPRTPSASSAIQPLQ